MGIKQSKNEPTKIDMRIIQAMAEKAQSGQIKIKSFNSIIMKFPKIDESFEEVKSVFKIFGQLYIYKYFKLLIIIISYDKYLNACQCIFIIKSLLR